MEARFVIRRAVAGVVIAPVVAGLYVVGVALLVGLGATASVDSGEAWGIGWLYGIASALVFVVFPLVEKVVNK
jgi:ABC-type sulfate transport system permease component